MAFIRAFFDKTLFGFVVLPMLGLIGSAYAQSGPNPNFFQVRPSSGCDLFGFLTILDANFFLFHDSVKRSINPQIASNFEVTFLFTGIIAAFFLMQSGKLQYAIVTRKRNAAYPVGAASLSMTVAFTLIAFHIFALVSH